MPSKLVLVLPVANKSDPAAASWYLSESYFPNMEGSVEPSDRGTPGRFMAGFADGHVGMIPRADLQDLETRRRHLMPNPATP